MHNVLEEQQQRDEEGVYKYQFSEHKIVSGIKRMLSREGIQKQIRGGQDLLLDVVGERLLDGQARDDHAYCSVTSRRGR